MTPEIGLINSSVVINWEVQAYENPHPNALYITRLLWDYKTGREQIGACGCLSSRHGVFHSWDTTRSMAGFRQPEGLPSPSADSGVGHEVRALKWRLPHPVYLDGQIHPLPLTHIQPLWQQSRALISSNIKCKCDYNDTFFWHLLFIWEAVGMPVCGVIFRHRESVVFF